MGDAYADHEYIGRPEDMNIPRPSFGVTATNPGTDLAAATAAAFAAGSIVFSATGKRWITHNNAHTPKL